MYQMYGFTLEFVFGKSENKKFYFLQFVDRG